MQTAIKIKTAKTAQQTANSKQQTANSRQTQTLNTVLS